MKKSIASLFVIMMFAFVSSSVFACEHCKQISKELTKTQENSKCECDENCKCENCKTCAKDCKCEKKLLKVFKKKCKCAN